MAQVVLGAAGKALGGGVGAVLGSALGALADRSLIESLRPERQVGPRLDGLRVTSTAEGAGLPAVFGRARVAGQVIWAARFREKREEGRSGGGKGGRTVAYRYSLSFAVALCEGPIDGVGRIWADGQPLDVSGLTWRVHRGGADQQPDALIEAVEGAAPAYRGTAYVVFEDLPLDPWGGRPPQLRFEVFRGVGGEASLERRLEGVCLIPGAGEFVYATEPVVRREGIARYASETVHTGSGAADLMVSLDQLQAHLPNLKRVSLVVSWFGDDLRCGVCTVRPGVETRTKDTHPWSWRAGGVGRDEARLLSGGPDAPAFGGTPADRAVLQAIAELKARGLEVTLYPLMMMDVPRGNGLADPWGGAEQAAFPWRGRITCDPAAGRAGSPDGSAEAAAQVAAFFGSAAPENVGTADGLPTWRGPAAWSYRRMVLHYARLAALAGGVDGFLIGSELRGLTGVQGPDGSFPAVEALRALAGDVRAMLGPETAISYAADWSELPARQAADGSGDLRFHLDALWADPAISYVGVDWYPPLTDWRAGDGGVDAAAWAGADDAGYLRAGVAGGEAYDWYYADEAAREAQARTPITDGAYGEPWVFRAKDLVGWWSNRHYDRVGGVRRVEPTAWTPGMKPIRFTEFGCPAVDRGGNAPNLFFDGRSSESARPPHSTGARDDRVQRNALEAVLGWFAEPANNPASASYGGPMLEAADAWCWDARPFPAFPARAEVWADAPSWTAGHWLNGRLGGGEGARLVAAVLERAGLTAAEYDVSEVRGAAGGYVIDQPMRTRDALAPLAATFGFDLAESGGRVACSAADGGGVVARRLGASDLAPPDEGPAVATERRLEPGPAAVQIRFIDEAASYQTGAVTVRAPAGGDGGTAALDLPLAITRGQAEAAGRRRLDAEAQDRATLRLGPLAALTLEPGDVVEAEGLSGAWRVAEVRLEETPTAALVRPLTMLDAGGDPDWRPEPPAPAGGPPVLHVLDLPPLPGAETDARPLIAAAAEPWRALDVWAGSGPEALTRRGGLDAPASVGLTLSTLPPLPHGRVSSRADLLLRLQGAAPISRSAAEVRGGANRLAMQTADGAWEVLAFHHAEPTAEADVWRLSGLIRGLAGTDAFIGAAPAGANVVLLDGGTERAAASDAERGLPRLWRAAPAGAPPGGGDAAEATAVWRGAASRPWAPAHLRMRRTPDGGRLATWISREAVGGDRLDVDGAPPAASRWRVEVRSGTAVLRSVEKTAPSWTYAAADDAVDLARAASLERTLHVSGFDAAWGWGPAAVLKI